MRLACCLLASLLAACSEPAPPKPAPPTQVYYQDYVVFDGPPGFKLAQPIEPAKADPKRFFWRATYDGEGRVVALETFAHPMCLQSQLNLTYAKDSVPVKRQRVPASDCKPGRTAPARTAGP